MKNIREVARAKRHKSIRLRLAGDNARPRLVVRRSLRNLFVQFMDDAAGKTLFSASTQDKEVKTKFPYAGNTKAAQFFGLYLAAKAKEKGITKIVFDRAGYLYHGRLKALAEALRKGGLQF